MASTSLISTLPKSVLSSPSLTDGSEDTSISSIKNSAKFFEVLRTTGSLALTELHQNRMKSLRKEIEYLKETEWKYQPIDKYIGQSF